LVQVAKDFIHIQQRRKEWRRAGCDPGLDGDNRMVTKTCALNRSGVLGKNAVTRTHPGRKAARLHQGLANAMYRSSDARMLLICKPGPCGLWPGKSITGKAPSLSKGGVWICRINSVRSGIYSGSRPTGMLEAGCVRANGSGRSSNPTRPIRL